MRQKSPSGPPSLGESLFAPRQVYVRSGPLCQYVALSRSLQVAVTAGMAVFVLWLGVASYTAVSQYVETAEQDRELTRLGSVTQALRAAFEKARDADQPNAGGAAGTDLVTEVAELQQSRARALMLADAAAGEADALRREVALAYERIRELELTLVRTELDETKPALTADAACATLADGRFEPISCPVP